MSEDTTTVTDTTTEQTTKKVFSQADANFGAKKLALLCISYNEGKPKPTLFGDVVLLGGKHKMSIRDSFKLALKATEATEERVDNVNLWLDNAISGYSQQVVSLFSEKSGDMSVKLTTKAYVEMLVSGKLPKASKADVAMAMYAAISGLVVKAETPEATE